ncbi:MAG: YebC/PmpR family DNA-binding transcriptional regulator [Verrucomicrobiota bacterium]|nr:YebC/PmpR family DNA-binding transcriptional regulator [Verrucomicrobiota bacterium]
MAGHSKWANIKHKKGRADAARAKVFSKISKEIMVAASGGGGNPDDNIQLRALIQKAKSVSMPKDNIERAIKKGTGELEGGRLEEGSYEGYAAGGVAVIVKVLTDNKNRSAAAVRHAFSKADANLAEQGSVSRMFKRKGQILINKNEIEEDKLMDIIIEAGAEDLKTYEEHYEVLTSPTDFEIVSEEISKAGINLDDSDITLISDTISEINDKDQAKKIMSFIESLEELDDVQNVYSNFDISEDIAKEIEEN